MLTTTITFRSTLCEGPPTTALAGARGQKLCIPFWTCVKKTCQRAPAPAPMFTPQNMNDWCLKSSVLWICPHWRFEHKPFAGEPLLGCLGWTSVGGVLGSQAIAFGGPLLNHYLDKAPPPIFLGLSIVTGEIRLVPSCLPGLCHPFASHRHQLHATPPGNERQEQGV